jgi:hypothetical protein
MFDLLYNTDYIHIDYCCLDAFFIIIIVVYKLKKSYYNLFYLSKLLHINYYISIVLIQINLNIIFWELTKTN